MKSDTFNGEHYSGQIFKNKKTGERFYLIRVFFGPGFKTYRISNGKMTIIIQDTELESDYEPDPGPWEDPQ
jgi:hypothetical protein